MATGKELSRLKGHQGDVAALAFAPDGQTLASGSRDTTGLIWDVKDLATGARPATAIDVEARWKDLLGDDAAKAFDALCVLSTVPGQTVPFLKDHVQPSIPGDAAKVRRLIADMDSEQFEVRQKASAELEKIGEAATPLLREALAGQPSLEARKRIEELLAKAIAVAPRGEVLRSLRAVEVLETIGTPEARQVLERLARGVPEARLTQEAKASLERLAKRSAARP
jgi:hypothetical protein